MVDALWRSVDAETLRVRLEAKLDARDGRHQRARSRGGGGCSELFQSSAGKTVDPADARPSQPPAAAVADEALGSSYTVLPRAAASAVLPAAAV